MIAQHRAAFAAGGAHLSLQRAQFSYWIQIDIDPSMAVGQPGARDCKGALLCTADGVALFTVNNHLCALPVHCGMAARLKKGNVASFSSFRVHARRHAVHTHGHGKSLSFWSDPPALMRDTLAHANNTLMPFSPCFPLCRPTQLPPHPWAHPFWSLPRPDG